MTTPQPPASIQASAAYAALRHGGTPPAHACAQLGLGRTVAHTLEQMFQSRRGGLRPRFARHALHVAAVRAQGGFPVLPERRR